MDIEIDPVDITGPKVIVPVSEDVRLHIPVPITARVRTDGYEAEIVVTPNPATGVPSWSKLTIESRDGTGSNDALRAFGMRGVLEEIVRRAGTRYVRKGKNRWGAEIVSGEDRPGPLEVTSAFKGRRHRVSEEEVEKAAAVYRQALADGRRDPTMAVSDAFHGMPRATAARRVQLARERGLLGPAVGTKAGEAK